MTKAVRWDAQQLAEYLRRTQPAKVAPAPDLPPSRAKYGNRKVEDADGVTHDSKKEARRWLELQARQAAGEISELQRQVKFVLIPKQQRDDGKAERECAYIADFVFVEGGKTIVSDAKGVKTKDYIIKRKLMLQVHGISVREI